MTSTQLRRIATVKKLTDITVKDHIAEVRKIKNWFDKKNSKPKTAAKRPRAGYKVLFFGAPGTGKTILASVIGKEIKQPVYRIGLPKVVSKYIGETEKNLQNIFDRAENKNWILFFDEAEALFGKRTEVRDAHDRYTNTEVNYLLKRIEHHKGLVIVSANLKNNIDSALIKRFNSVIYFSND